MELSRKCGFVSGVANSPRKLSAERERCFAGLALRSKHQWKTSSENGNLEVTTKLMILEHECHHILVQDNFLSLENVAKHDHVYQ